MPVCWECGWPIADNVWQEWGCIGIAPEFDGRFGRLEWDGLGNAYRVRCSHCRLRICQRELEEALFNFNVVLTQVWLLRNLLYFSDQYSDHEARNHAAIVLHELATNYDWDWQDGFYGA